MVCYSFSGFDGYSHFEKNVFLLERFGRVYLLFRQQLGGKELVAEGTFFRNQGVILNSVRQPDRLAFPLEAHGVYVSIVSSQEETGGTETTGRCVRKYDISAFAPAEHSEVPGGGTCE
jgi:hypothetical protein